MTIVNTNVAALSAQSSMMKNAKDMESAMAKLSSGHRINTAADDAAGLSISERMEMQVRGLSQAIRNAEDAQNMIDSIEGASAEIVTSLQRLKELAIQAASTTNTATDRGFIQQEAGQLLQEIDRIAGETSWNGQKVLNGRFDGKDVQVGVNAGENIQVGVSSQMANDIGNYVLRGDAIDTAAATAAASNGRTGGSVRVAGFAGDATFTSQAGDSAKVHAEDINSISHLTGVTAKAATHAHVKSLSAAGTVELRIGNRDEAGVPQAAAATDNGQNVASFTTVTAVIEDENDLRALRDAINNASESTGVTASLFAGQRNELLLTDSDGDDIVLSNFDHTTGSAKVEVRAYNFHGQSSTSSSAITTLEQGASNASTIMGNVELSSSQAFKIVSAAADYFGAGTTQYATFSAVGDIDLSTKIGAEKALDAIESAINMVNTERAQLGATANRLDKTINNLTTVVENTAASKSHIKDADFAAETSKLTKAQILNQAATSMLAQANASKQTVLALLQN